MIQSFSNVQKVFAVFSHEIVTALFVTAQFQFGHSLSRIHALKTMTQISCGVLKHTIAHVHTNSPVAVRALIIAVWRLMVNLGCRRPIKAPALVWRIQVKQFSYLTAHAVVITISPNCGAEQALASFTTAVCSVDVHGVILLHAHSWLLAM
jgi:hypothetical protein